MLCTAYCLQAYFILCTSVLNIVYKCTEYCVQVYWILCTCVLHIVYLPYVYPAGTFWPVDRQNCTVTYSPAVNCPPKKGTRLKVALFNIQCDRLNMAVFFGTFKKLLVQCTLLYTCALQTSHFLEGTRKTRPCLIGHPVSVKGSKRVHKLHTYVVNLYMCNVFHAYVLRITL